MDQGAAVEVGGKRFASGQTVECERKRRMKNASKVYGLRHQMTCNFLG